MKEIISMGIVVDTRREARISHEPCDRQRSIRTPGGAAANANSAAERCLCPGTHVWYTGWGRRTAAAEFMR